MQTTPSRHAIAPGEVVADRYQIGDLLGRGGMAEVYEGIDLRLERPVAIKVLRPEVAVRDDVRTRFEAEARAAAGLSHPNAVAVFDTGEHGGAPFLVMERLPGDTLADRIAAGPVDAGWLRKVAVGVLGALAAAHRAGIVHRDVKPGNILLTPGGGAKIADFGIAKSIHPADGSEGDSVDLTASGQLMGTPAYLAPERIEGMPATPRSDLWALGVVLYEALAGEKPFTGRGPLDVAHAVVKGEHVPLGERRPDVDPGFVRTVERALSNDPAHRFATADDMAAALDGGEADITVDQAVGDGTMVLPLPEAPLRSGARRRGGGWIVAALVLLLALLLFVRDRPSYLESAAREGANDTPATTVSTPSSTTPAQGLASRLRDLAGRVSPPNDGPRAPELADGLRRVADAVEAESPGAGGQATSLLVSVAIWTHADQLATGTAVEAIRLLQEVPGVQVPGQAPATTAAPPAVQQPPATAAPAAPSAPAAPHAGRDQGRGNDSGADKGDDKADDRGNGRGRGNGDD